MKYFVVPQFFYAKIQVISSAVSKLRGRILFLLASLARGTTKFCILVFPALNSATASNNSRSKPFLSDGSTTVEGWNNGGRVLNRNPEPCLRDNNLNFARFRYGILDSSASCTKSNVSTMPV